MGKLNESLLDIVLEANIDETGFPFCNSSNLLLPVNLP